jgi:hypothetical protein
MKLARTLLAVLTLSVLTACADSVTAPVAEPQAAPSTSCGTLVAETLADGSVVYRCAPQIGSGG